MSGLETLAPTARASVPIFRELTRPSDVVEILDEEEIQWFVFASNLLRKSAEDKGVISAVT